jgi:hypothetical protein
MLLSLGIGYSLRRSHLDHLELSALRYQFKTEVERYLREAAGNGRLHINGPGPMKYVSEPILVN